MARRFIVSKKDSAPVGLMNAEQFIANDGNEINTYELAKVRLYFAGEIGRAHV